MAKKTNTSKTAHVMNLLSKNQETAPAAPASDETPADAGQQEAAPTPVAPPSILPSLNLDLEISTQIKSALEDSLDNGPDGPAAETQKTPEPVQPQDVSETIQAPPELEQTSDETAAAEPEIQEPVPEPSAQPAESKDESEAVSAEPSTVQMAEGEAFTSDIPGAAQESPSTEVALPALEQEPVEKPAAAESQAVPEAQEPVPESSAQPATSEDGDEGISTDAPVQAAEDRIVFTNIMQTLVEKKVDRYIQMFGLCSCPKCVADVKAIALNNLVPKYIVTVPEEESPWVTIYEGRFSAEVTAQILHACKIVMENPLHDL